MKRLNKIASVFCAAALGLLSLTGCEGGDIYNVDSPDWISEKIDSINNAKNAGNEEVWTDLNEDVYTIGNTDFTSGWWSAFSKYYQIPEGKEWHAVFNLSVNPNDNTYYKNFALIVTNDVDRGGTGYQEYGAFRYDYTSDSTAFNSQWGNYLWFRYANSTQIMSPVDNKDAGLQQLGGQVKLSVDRTNPDSFRIKITNGTVTKTLNEPYHLPNLNADATNTNIRCFLVPEGSYINFLSSNIEPIGGYTSAADKNPVSMVLNNVPDEVPLNSVVDSAMKNVSATVTFEEGVTKEVPASELMFVNVPGMDTEGEKTLIAIYNKTFKGENAATPITAEAKFNVVDQPTSIEVTTNPTNRRYYLFSAPGIEIANRTFAFDPTGMVVTGTFPDGSQRVIDNSKLTFTEVPATVGTHEVTISTSNGLTATTRIRVQESKSEFVSNVSPTVLGAEDNTTGWWAAHLDNDIQVPATETRQFSFTNYAGALNWNNWVVVLRNTAKHEYGVLRADNYGWGDGYNTVKLSGGQADWTTWLAAMNGAKCSVWVTNVGNGTADVQAVMNGTDGKTYTQYYLGLSTIVANDLFVDFTVDSDHLVFSSTAFSKRHYAPRYAHRRR